MPTTFANTINGNEILAKRAECDYAGNDIQTTYATKSEVTTGLSAKQDTISDLATIRSGAALGATAVQPADLATVATTGAYSDLSGTPTIPTATSDLTNDSGFITLSDVPAQVNADWNAVSGAAEILNKPTIPSGSDLVPPYTLPTDEGKVLTIGPSTTYWATPAAGGVTDVEVDGTSVVSQGVASITMPTVDQTYDGTSTNAQSGTAIAGEIANLAQVPTVTSSDDGKVLTADYTGGVASYSWETPSSTWPGLFEATYNVTTYADIVQAISEKKVVYCRISTGASRMAFLAYIGSSNVEFQYYRSVSSKSATNQGDEIYVYTVSSSGWTTTTRNTYTRITAGTNMTQSYSSGVLTLSADDQLPAATSSDEGKVLTIDSNGDPQWATGGGGGGTQADWTEDDPTAASYIENKPTPKTLTAGTGISITENSSTITIANTAPDTVASLPTNLTAAQIQAFKEALGVDETVLWENQNGAILNNGITLSESRLNFEYIRLEVSCQTDSDSPRAYVDIPMSGINAGSSFQFGLNAPFNNETIATFALNWKVLMTATNTTLTSTNALYWGKSGFDGTSANAGTWVQGSNVNVPYIYKVVGCRRIASN